MRLLMAFISSVLLAIGTLVPVFAASPTLNVQEPTNNVTINGSSATLRFTTTDVKIVPTNIPVSEAGKHPEANKPGEGHLHFVLDLQPLVVWDKTEPYTFKDIAPGNHQLMVEVVNNDHSSLYPKVMQQIQFRTAPALPPTGALELSGLASVFGLVFAVMSALIVLSRSGVFKSSRA